MCFYVTDLVRLHTDQWQNLSLWFLKVIQLGGFAVIGYHKLYFFSLTY